MMLSNEDENFDANYQQLLNHIGIALPKDEVKLKKRKRTEPSKDVSMFTVSQVDKGGSKDKVHLHELMQSVPQSGHINKLKRKIDKVEKPSTQLSAPLPRPISEKIQRKAEYKKTSEDVSKWDQVVQKNRKAEHLSFPLDQEPFHIQTVGNFFQSKKNLTPLEKEMYALLSNNKCTERPDHELTLMEEEAMAAMNLQEAKARLIELRKHNALLSYHQAKNKRQNKIKSRSYRRMVRKQRMKEHLKSGTLKEGDLQTQEQERAEERASLRHRRGSKWTKKVQLVTKYNEKLKFDMEEQRWKHLQLVKKPPQSESDSHDSEVEEDSTPVVDFFRAIKTVDSNLPIISVQNNPWLRHTADKSSTPSNNTSANVSASQTENKSNTESLKEKVDLKKDVSKDFSKMLNSKVRNVTLQKPQRVSNEEKAKFKEAVAKLSDLTAEENIKDENDSDIEQDESNSVSIELVPSSNDGLLEANCCVSDEETLMLEKNSKSGKKKKSSSKIKPKTSHTFGTTTKVSSKLMSAPVEGFQLEEQKMSIEEAFANDDVVAEFDAQKNELIEAANIELETDLTLPGWGHWGGSGIQPRKKKFQKPPPPIVPRKDINLGHVILSEKRDVYVANHQVHHLPFPYENTEQFEKSIARPIGNTWNTPEVFSSSIKPGVTNPMGTIILPMTLNELSAKNEDEGEVTTQPKLKQTRKRKRKIAKKQGTP